MTFSAKVFLGVACACLLADAGNRVSAQLPPRASTTAAEPGAEQACQAELSVSKELAANYLQQIGLYRNERERLIARITALEAELAAARPQGGQ
jgi:hypothetical protein